VVTDWRESDRFDGEIEPLPLALAPPARAVAAAAFALVLLDRFLDLRAQ
jgi:hypothetical protein